jgi:preprotein translocase subunit YajC
MKIVNRNLPKQILFLITLFLAITPACKQQQKHRNLTNAHLAITAGSLEIAAGLSSFAPIIPTAAVCGAPFVFLTLIPGLLIAGGIYTLVWGIQVKKEIEQEKRTQTTQPEEEYNYPHS